MRCDERAPATAVRESSCVESWRVKVVAVEDGEEEGELGGDLAAKVVNPEQANRGSRRARKKRRQRAGRARCVCPKKEAGRRKPQGASGSLTSSQIGLPPGRGTRWAADWWWEK